MAESHKVINQTLLPTDGRTDKVGYNSRAEKKWNHSPNIFYFNNNCFPLFKKAKCRFFQLLSKPLIFFAFLLKIR